MPPQAAVAEEVELRRRAATPQLRRGGAAVAILEHAALFVAALKQQFRVPALSDCRGYENLHSAWDYLTD